MDARTGKVGDAVREVGADLWDWSRNILGDLEKRISRVKKKLEDCRRRAISEHKVAREEILKYKFKKLEAQKELYWHQRAQTHWLQKGDRNTKKFHGFASERRRRNRIRRLVGDDGVEVKEER